MRQSRSSGSVGASSGLRVGQPYPGSNKRSKQMSECFGWRLNACMADSRPTEQGIRSVAWSNAVWPASVSASPLLSRSKSLTPSSSSKSRICRDTAGYEILIRAAARLIFCSSATMTKSRRFLSYMMWYNQKAWLTKTKGIRESLSERSLLGNEKHDHRHFRLCPTRR